MKYTRTELVKEAIGNIKVNIFDIRKMDEYTESIIKKYDLREEDVLIFGDLVVWAYYKVPFPEDKSKDIIVEEDGYERKISSCKNIDGSFSISGYYPAVKSALPLPVSVKKVDELHHVIMFGQKEVHIWYEPTPETKKVLIDGYRGAATMREYYETKDLPDVYAEYPINRFMVGTDKVYSSITVGNANSFIYTIKELKVDADTIEFDVYTDTYTKYCTVRLSDAGDVIEVGGNSYMIP